MRVLMLPNGSPRVPSARMRAFQFVEPLRDLGIEVDVLHLQSLKPRRGRTWLYRAAILRAARRADVVFVQKLLLQVPVLRALRAVNPAIVFDYDDALYSARDGGPRDATRLARLHAAFDAARVVSAGNEELAAYAREHGAREVRVVPTVIDAGEYRPRRNDAPGDRIVVGWSGTAQNLEYLELIRPALRELVQEDPRIVLRVVSSERLDWPELPVEHETWTLERAIAATEEFDIGVMPLPDTRWTRGKCAFKAIEYMALGIPPVASPVGMTRDVVSDGVDGFLPTDEGQWRDALGRLAADEGLRRRLGERARETVEARYSIDAAAPALAEALRAAAR